MSQYYISSVLSYDQQLKFDFAATVCKRYDVMTDDTALICCKDSRRSRVSNKISFGSKITNRKSRLEASPLVIF